MGIHQVDEEVKLILDREIEVLVATTIMHRPHVHGVEAGSQSCF
jgi:hypothetical protein